jgi:formate dehydrogenase
MSFEKEARSGKSGLSPVQRSGKEPSLIYARDGIQRIEMYADGRTMPSPTAMDFVPGELLGDVIGALALRKFLAARGHSLTVLEGQDGPTSRFDQELPEAEIVISQSCWPAHLNACASPTRASFGM